MPSPGRLKDKFGIGEFKSVLPPHKTHLDYFNLADSVYFKSLMMLDSHYYSFIIILYGSQHTRTPVTKGSI